MENETTFDSDVSTDNSETYSDADIANALDDSVEEPETQADEGNEKGADASDDNADATQSNLDNTDTNQCPEKFRNEDGTVNVDNLLKSYKELEPLVNEKSNWEKERADLEQYKKQVEEMQNKREQEARDAGFNSVQDMEFKYGVAAFEANEYAKYLAYTDDPEAVRQMLISYQNNPTEKLMEDIEMEFSPDINKRVAIASTKAQAQYEQNLAQQQQSHKLVNIENIIGQTVDANSEVFDYEPFKKMFIGLLQKYGDAIQPEDAILMANTFSSMKDEYRKEFEKLSGKKIENDNATNKLATLSDNKSAPASSQPENWENLSQKELEKYISKYI